ncbi:DUF2274 domain-containing protein [Sphingomonas oryzagri]
MSGLKLGRLPDRTPLKISLVLPPDLHHALQQYAEIYRETYGEAQPVSELILAMLAAFLASDRAFAKMRAGGAERLL